MVANILRWILWFITLGRYCPTHKRWNEWRFCIGAAPGCAPKEWFCPDCEDGDDYEDDYGC